MANGIDEAWSRASIAALQANGVTFVCRYLSYDNTGKNLSLAEAQALSAAGISVVSNWEYATRAALNGYAQGVKDAQAALAQHNADGGEAGAPIYFSADWDVQPSELGAVDNYYRGVASVLGVGRTGGYGGKRLITHLFDAGLITWGWQTYAWSGGQWDSRAQIRQVQNGVKIGGADVDRDTSMVNYFGQWKVGQAAPVPTPTPAPAPAPGGRPVLSKGAKGDTVRVAQGLLWGNGFKPIGGIDGDFGAGTDTAVRAFQRAQGIGVDGVIGSVTWGRLVGSEPVVKRGSTGQAVRNVQGLLYAHGFNPKGVDGNFGPGCEAAVRAFQQFKQIGVDGVVGPATWGRLIPAA